MKDIHKAREQKISLLKQLNNILIIEDKYKSKVAKDVYKNRYRLSKWFPGFDSDTI